MKRWCVSACSDWPLVLQGHTHWLTGSCELQVHAVAHWLELCYWPLQGLLSSWWAESSLVRGRAWRCLVWLSGSSIHCRMVSLRSWVTGSQKISCLLLRLLRASSAPAAAPLCTPQAPSSSLCCLLVGSVQFAGCFCPSQMSKSSRKSNNTPLITCIDTRPCTGTASLSEPCLLQYTTVHNDNSVYFRQS